MKWKMKLSYNVDFVVELMGIMGWGLKWFNRKWGLQVIKGPYITPYTTPYTTPWKHWATATQFWPHVDIYCTRVHSNRGLGNVVRSKGHEAWKFSTRMFAHVKFVPPNSALYKLSAAGNISIFWAFLSSVCRSTEGWEIWDQSFLSGIIIILGRTKDKVVGPSGSESALQPGFLLVTGFF